jgi:hypothetical protein
MKKTRKIKQRICTLDQHLAAAEEYVAKNANVRGFPSWLKLSDWKGKSGHPLLDEESYDTLDAESAG